jgi:geranylgeranyl pyrophosphate synthase
MTETKYQTPAHMRIVYAVAAALELVVLVSIIIDDELDDVTSRSGVDSWHLKSPVPTAGDCILLNELARMVIRTCVPDSHPSKADLIRLIDDTIVEVANYFVLPTFLQAPKNNQQPKRGFPFSIELITRDTVASRNYVRAGKWLYNLFNLPRLAACYTGLRPDDMGIIRDQIFRVSDILCIIDDLHDLPNPEKSLDSLTKDDLSDILSCELQNQLLLAALEHARSSSHGDEKNAIFDILQSRYGTNDLGDARIVTDLYRKYNIAGHVKDTLRQTVEAYRRVSQTQATHLNMPQDIIYYLARFFLIGQRVVEMVNDEKTGKMLKLFQQLGQNIMLSSVEKENMILKLVEKL